MSVTDVTAAALAEGVHAPVGAEPDSTLRRPGAAGGGAAGAGARSARADFHDRGGTVLMWRVPIG